MWLSCTLFLKPQILFLTYYLLTIYKNFALTIYSRVGINIIPVFNNAILRNDG